MWVNQHKSLFDCRDARFCVSTFICIWFIVNLLQGIFTEIQEDEAYYALYGEHLAWGYFDHPPMVGLFRPPAYGGTDDLPQQHFLLGDIGRTVFYHYHVLCVIVRDMVDCDFNP